MLWTLFNPDVSEEFDFYDQTVSPLQEDLFLLEKMLKMKQNKRKQNDPFPPCFWHSFTALEFICGKRCHIVSMRQMQLSWLGFEFS